MFDQPIGNEKLSVSFDGVKFDLRMPRQGEMMEVQL